MSWWQPISEPDIQNLIAKGEAAMEPAVERFWRRIRVRPEKWQLPPWGDEGGGFWVVAVVGNECFWFNDIEDGFNVSRFEEFGRIDQYRCNQSDLDSCVRGYLRDLVHEIGAEGIDIGVE